MHYDSNGHAWVAESRDELFGWTIVSEELFKPGVTRALITRTNDGRLEQRQVYINDPLAELHYVELRIESVMDNAAMQAADMIEQQLRLEMLRIQRKHLRRHTLKLQDAMGSISLYVYAGEWSVDTCVVARNYRIAGLGHEVPEWLEQLDALLVWYCRVADYARASCEIEVTP